MGVYTLLSCNPAAVNYDEATMAQVERIQKEVVTLDPNSIQRTHVVTDVSWNSQTTVTHVQIAESSLLVGGREDLSSLGKEYAVDDVIYQAKIQVSGFDLCTVFAEAVISVFNFFGFSVLWSKVLLLRDHMV